MFKIIGNGTVTRADMRRGERGEFLSITVETNTSFDGSSAYTKKIGGTVNRNLETWRTELVAGTEIMFEASAPRARAYTDKQSGDLRASIEVNFDRLEKVGTSATPSVNYSNMRSEVSPVAQGDDIPF